MINHRRLIELTKALIAIDSQNPTGDESAVARFVGDHLKGMGLKPRFVEFKKGRTNVICRVKGGGGKSLIITPHLDTVPAGKGWSRDPFRATLEKGRLYGLGATDCKGNLACALEAMQSLREEKFALGYDLIFAATADEESGSSLGLEPLLRKNILRADAAVVLDTEDFHIIVAQKGLLHLKVRLRGKRAHGAYPWLGVNAIDAAVSVVSDLKRARFPFRRDPYLRPPTVNTGVIRGGDKVNVVADWCEIELDFRFLPGTKARSLVAAVRRVVSRRSRDYEIEVDGTQLPYRISEKHPLVLQLSKAMRRQSVRPTLEGSEGATVISFFQKFGIPSVATGFGTAGCCHVADEYVEADNLYKGALVLEGFLRDFSFNARKGG